MPTVNEVPGEPDSRPCGTAVGAQCANAEQGVIPAATLDPSRDLSRISEGASMPTLIDLEDVLEPACVDVGARVHRQQVARSLVVRDDVAGNARQRRRIRRQLGKQPAMSPGI